jgi:ADP-heptose:LPS heptosyltransferase
MIDLVEEGMKKILVVRNDKIGDFMLAWPSFAMLKKSLPSAYITALVPNYTVALAQLCPWIDEVIVDTTKKASKQQQKALVTVIKDNEFDAAICLFSDSYNAKLIWQAKIPYRLAPATKLAQVLYNKRVKQRRSRSEKPEFEYNLDLIRYFLNDIGCPVVEPQAPYLVFAPESLLEQKETLAATLNLDKTAPWCFVHAGSGGSANNLSLEQYATLISGLAAKQNYEFVLTAGPGEEQKARELKALLPNNVRAVVYDKNSGLQDFTCSIACADLFVAGSTGPLHIAATLDIPTIGFFPSKRSATPLRWKTINSEGRHIAFCPNSGKEQETDMSTIDLERVLVDVTSWLKKYSF